jgi:hypothetical protein
MVFLRGEENLHRFCVYMYICCMHMARLRNSGAAVRGFVRWLHHRFTRKDMYRSSARAQNIEDAQVQRMNLNSKTGLQNPALAA